jgi:hypothetical protein
MKVTEKLWTKVRPELERRAWRAATPGTGQSRQYFDRSWTCLGYISE